MFSSKVISEEFVLRSLKASPLMNEAFCDAWWVTRIEIRVLEFPCRLEVCSHVKDTILVEPLSKNVVSVSDISAVNLIVGWKLFAFRRNSSISFLLVSYTDMKSSINLFQKMA